MWGKLGLEQSGKNAILDTDQSMTSYLTKILQLWFEDTLPLKTIIASFIEYAKVQFSFLFVEHLPPVDLHWFFEISIRTEKKNQLELKKNFKLTEIFFQCSLKFFFSSSLK